MASFWSRVVAGTKAFREAFFSTDALDGSDFSEFDARRLRYALYWSYFENTAYRDTHTWAKKMRADYGLYKHIRNIYNPSYRLGSFWRTHLFGGALDRAAGDGRAVPSALPILTDNEALRPALARLWRDSNWQVNKGLLGLHGAILGDVGLRVVDDVARGKVYLEVLHPGLIKCLELDPFGNVKGYELEEQRPDPRGGKQLVTYTERATRDGDAVVYLTLLNGAPYAWNGVTATWMEPYGFIPLVMLQHNNVGLDWGWSELHPGLSKIREADDLASKLSDQIRKTVDAPWLFAGLKKNDATPSTRGADSSTTRPEPGREEIPALYASDPATKAQALVAPLDIAAVGGRIDSILAELERDYPELQMDIWAATGDTSGKALRVARQRTEAKVDERRASYDDGVVRAQQMAVAIGGHRGYQGFQGFGLDSYAAGALDHQIGKRPVFAVDPLDGLEEDKLFWDIALVAKQTGAGLDAILADAGWDAERIARFTSSPEYQARLRLLTMDMSLEGAADG